MRRKEYFRYYRIADITIQVESELPFSHETFHPKFKLFEVNNPGKDTVVVHHYFALPKINPQTLGEPVYKRSPWLIYKNNGSWIYLGISSLQKRLKEPFYRMAVFNSNHSRGRLYNKNDYLFRRGALFSLTNFPSDQILLARILADRKGCFLHSCGVDFNGKGLLFVGHSGAGKSTMARLLKGKAKILCDDRIILRKYKEGFKIFGTWSHGTVPDISPESCPLKAIFFLKKSKYNRIVPLNDKKILVKNMLSCVVRPLVTKDWWQKTLDLVDEVITSIPCYELYFDKSRKVVNFLKSL